MDKQNVIYPYNAILFSSKSTDTCYSMDEPQKHAKCKKPDTKGYYCLVIYMWNVSIGNPVKTESFWLPGTREMETGEWQLMGKWFSLDNDENL